MSCAIAGCRQPTVVRVEDRWFCNHHYAQWEASLTESQMVAERTKGEIERLRDHANWEEWKMEHEGWPHGLLSCLWHGPAFACAMVFALPLTGTIGIGISETTSIGFPAAMAGIYAALACLGCVGSLHIWTRRFVAIERWRTRIHQVGGNPRMNPAFKHKELQPCRT